MTYQYMWLEGRSRAVDANLFGNAMEQCTTAAGVDKEKLIQLAEPEDSPLHQLYNWDKEAIFKADLHRQTRALLASITKYEVGAPTQQPPVRAVVNIPQTTKTEQAYHTATSVQSDAEKRVAFLAQVIREFESWRDKRLEQAFAMGVDRTDSLMNAITGLKIQLQILLDDLKGGRGAAA